MTAWTDDRVIRLKTLWREGLSASAVARQLGGGLTRNAVIGKVHRLGLSGRAAPSAPARLKPAPADRPMRPRPPSLQRVATPPSACVVPSDGAEPLEPAVSLLRLSARGCRFGLGDPRSETFGFCGAPQVRGPYCAHHAEIVYQPPSPARAKAERKLIEHVRRTG